MSLIAVGLEAGQMLIHGRHARPLDALEKLSGGVAGVLVLLAVLAFVDRRRARR